MNIETRLTELESRLAFQEQTINELNDVVVSLRQQLDRAERYAEQLSKRLAESATDTDSSSSVSVNERPPHY